MSVSLFLFVLHLLTHVVLINFISPVISAFAIVEIYSVYTLAYFRLEKSRVPKIEKRENEKKKSGRKLGRGRAAPPPPPLDVAAARKRSHQWYVSLTPNNNNAIERMTCHCFLQPIRRDLTTISYTTPTLPLFPSQALIFTRHSYDLRAWNRLLHPRLIQPESGFILGIVLFN